MIVKSVEFSTNQVGFITLYFGARLRLYFVALFNVPGVTTAINPAAEVVYSIDDRYSAADITGILEAVKSCALRVISISACALSAV